MSAYVWTPETPGAMRPMADLPLTAATGETAWADDYGGKVLVFGCVSCWGAGGSVLDELACALRHLDDRADEVQVLVVSVAPHRDTPEGLAARVTAYDPRFVGVMGSPGALRRSV
jgi:protein SCO1/2